MSRALTARLIASSKWNVARRWMPQRAVERRVQGVRLVMPRSHRLSEYAARYPRYGQNLVDLAGLLGDHTQELSVVDVGANIGDSALQVLRRTDARILCVEGDPYWAAYIRRNVANEDRIEIEEALVATHATTASTSPTRVGGTTRFGDGNASTSQPPSSLIMADDLRDRHSRFDHADLIKSDTDGYDVALIPALAQAWRDSRPVLFFEYDPELTATAGLENPSRVWEELAQLGYGTVGIWDNFGNALGLGDVRSMSDWTQRLRKDTQAKRYHYWDVAVAHADDTEAELAIAKLCGT